MIVGAGGGTTGAVGGVTGAGGVGTTMGVGTTIGVGTTGVGAVGILRDKLLSLCNNRAKTSISDSAAFRRRLFIEFCEDDETALASYHSFFSFLSADISNKSGMCSVCWRSRRSGNFSSSTAAVVVTHTAISINVFVNFIMFIGYCKFQIVRIGE